MRRYVFKLAVLAFAVLGASAVLADDQQIAQTIVQKLQAEKKAGSLKGFSIDLSVEEGTVWLSGRVATSQQQNKALDIARRVPGVKQVVNDLKVDKLAESKRKGSTIASFTSAVKNAVGAGESPTAIQAVEQSPVGTGVNNAESQNLPPAPIPYAAQQVPQQFPQQMQQQPQQLQQRVPYVYARPGAQVPMAYAPARTISHQGELGGVAGSPVPMHSPGSSLGIAPAQYDHPQMPGYAWPSYAAHPNYAGVSYPKQYSPTAWPYIGPFYPYPQVPLGWRKVSLEWDDGWWFLDFKDRRTTR